jgi:hypothetical protein
VGGVVGRGACVVGAAVTGAGAAVTGAGVAADGRVVAGGAAADVLPPDVLPADVPPAGCAVADPVEAPDDDVWEPGAAPTGTSEGGTMEPSGNRAGVDACPAIPPEAVTSRATAGASAP